MQEESFRVKYVSISNCFVYLPEHWLRKLSSRPSVVKVQHNDVNYYLSWYTRPSPDSSSLCLSATFARTLNIKEGDEVFVSCVEEAPPLTSLVVAPKNSHDREILELQFANIQSNLLDQIRIVAKDQTIVAWVSKFLPITLIVQSLDPAFKYGRLEERTEVHVSGALTELSPVTRIAAGDGLETPPPPSSSAGESSARVYSVRPLPAGWSDYRPFKVYLRRRLVTGEVPRLCKLRKVRENAKTPVSFLNKVSHPEEAVVQLCTLEELIDRSPQASGTDQLDFLGKHTSIYVSQDLLRTLRLNYRGKVVLEPVDEQEDVKCSHIEVSIRRDSEDDFRDYLSRASLEEKLLLNSRANIVLENGTRCQLRLMPESCSYTLIDADEARRISLVITDANDVDETRILEETTEVDGEAGNIVADVLQPIIAECLDTLTLSLGLHEFGDFESDRENILITGNTGSGKTTVCRLLSKILSEPPYFVNTRFVDCRSLKGKKVEVIQKLLTSEMSASVYYQPTVLFFDDIESITSAGSSTEETTPDSTNAARITDAIFSTIKEYQTLHYISVVATCTDANKVGKRLRAVGGSRFFQTILKIPNLEKEDRIKILRSSLRDKLYPAKEIDWDHYGNKTEGWVVQDLVALADKAAFAAWKRHVKEKNQGSLMLRDEDLSSTFSLCTPVALQGVNLFQGAGHRWSDIGGLDEVKRDLVEILHWPLRYPAVFKRAPVKLQSGVLLYGMPGTGKTMLAGAIAKECGLNLISVKGPELLSKYIGASEEAVRNVFEKAERAKPCVLFFDEFDSLAPRRGHDSTGVTDRVVNQLLTQLDGVEDREGVAVVAATSRPDLLDPAILRRGRIDKMMLCDLPTKSEREEILEKLCLMQDISTEDLDFKALAELTPGFCGADLAGVVTQARVNALHDNEIVTQRELEKYANSTRPTLRPAQKEMYDRIYSVFASMESISTEDFIKQRATLG